MTAKKQNKKLPALAVEFVKLQLSANILFWGTIGGLFLLYEIAGWGQTIALATASIVAHILFFLVNKEWVFDDITGKRKTSREIVRFVLFMGLNYIINLGIVTGLGYYFGLNPYLGQVVAALFFTVWNFVGLKYWVFQDTKHHGLRIGYAKVKKGVKRHARRAVRRATNTA